jgi:hypothetical protein
LDRVRGLVVPESGTVDDRSSEMTLAQSVAEILSDHVTLEVEGIDRMYLNAVVPLLQSERGIAWYFREYRGYAFASSALTAPMTRAFVEAVEDFARSEKVDCSYFPYNAKLCINGHEYAKRQLDRRGIRYEALDNGILSCEEPAVLQRITGPALRPVLHPQLRSSPPSRTRSRPPGSSRHRLELASLLPPARDRHDFLGRTGETCLVKLDSTDNIKRIQGS